MILAIVLSALLLAGIWTLSLLLSWPLWIAILASALAVLGWAAFLVWRRWKASKASGDLEHALESQAAGQARSARPDQQEEIEAMQKEFQLAIRALKSSKLARGGKNALAVLPWYMIIGPPGAGKSTALRASGLKFPYLSKRGGVRGVGGTRNCEWWLTNEAVLLDTAGRYATEEEDHEEWTSFLDLLARTRPREPINGIVVAVSISEVGGENDEGAAELGRRLRERVDEVMARLQLVLPVYVLFTKCDLLPGFVETFSDLKKGERGKVWGFTLPLDESGDRAEVFRERFDELVGVIEERSLKRLAEERSLESRERVYEFPQQLDAVKGPLTSFVGALFTENVYQDSPFLRGVYFTSGTQEGRLVDRVMREMAKQMGVRPAVIETAQVVETKSYFLRDVFTAIMIPDRGVAHRSAKVVRKERIRAWALAAVAGVLALLALAFPLGSFLANRDLVSTTGRLTESVAERLKGAGQGLPPVKELEPLREQLDLLVTYGEKGAPVSMRLGLYQGDRLKDSVRSLYAGAVRRLVIDPVFRADVEEMNAFVQRLESTGAAPAETDHARFYEKLKLHLLLTSPRMQGEPSIGEAEGAFIARKIGEAWQARWGTAADPDGPKLAEKNARLFAKLLAEDPQLALPRYQDLVQRERRVLARLPMSRLAIERLAAELEAKGYDLTLQSILGSPVPALRAGAGVRGLFTRRAYEEVVKQRLGDPASLVELWVVTGGGAEGREQADRELARLRSRYFERYVDEWRRFIESISVASAEIAPLALLQDLSHGEPPPYARLFRAVGYNANLAGALGAVKQQATGLLGGLMGGSGAAQAAANVAGRAREQEEKLLGPEDVERALGGFASFGFAPEPPPAAGGTPPPKVTLPVDLYQEQLAAVREALQLTLDGGDGAALAAAVSKARNQVQTLVNAREVGWRPRLKTLLLPPIDVAEEFRSGEEVRQASGKWCSEVALWYRNNLAGKYPFVREAREDAAVGDVAAFFRPGSGLVWKFYNESLARAVQRAGRGFQFVRAGERTPPYRAELLTFLRRAQDLTAALFPPGSAEPNVAMTVRVRPTPRIAAVFLDLDGQRIEYRNGPEEWNKVAWPGGGKTNSASLRVRAAGGADETLMRDGDWAVFRLLESGNVRSGAGSQAFTIGFPMRTLGAEITVDFRPARSETPFFATAHGAGARFLEPFRNIVLPLSIGGPPCTEGASAGR